MFDFVKNTDEPVSSGLTEGVCVGTKYIDSADEQFENIFKAKLFYSADEVPHILNKYFECRWALRTPIICLKRIL